MEILQRPLNYLKPVQGIGLKPTHSLTTGMSGAYPIHEAGGGRFINHVAETHTPPSLGGNSDLVNGAAGWNPGRPGDGGIGVRFNGTGYLTAKNPTQAYDLSTGNVPGWSLAIKFRLASTTGAVGICSLGNTNQETEPAYLLASNGSTNVRVLLGNAAYQVIATSPTVGVWYTVLSTFSTVLKGGQTGTESHYLRVGASCTQVYSGSLTTATGGNVLGNNLYLASGFGGARAMDCEFLYLWDRRLTYAEALSVLADPYQMWDYGRVVSVKSPVSDVQFDQAGNSGDQLASSSYTFNRTVTANANRYLLFKVVILGATNAVTSVTDDNAGTPVSATFIAGANNAANTARVEYWGVVAPVAGTKQVSVVISGAAVESVTLWVSRYNVHQTVPTEAFSSNAGTGDSATDAVTTVADRDWVDWTLATAATGGVSFDHTARSTVNGTAGSALDADTNSVVTPAGSVTGTATGNGITGAWLMVGLGIRPTTASSATNYARTVVDNLALTDAVLRAAPSFRLRSDNLGLTDLQTRRFAGFRSTFDNLGITDAEKTKTSSSRQTSDNVGGADTEKSQTNSFRNQTDNLGSTDSEKTKTASFRNQTDNAGITDAAARAFAGFRSVLDNLGLTDLTFRLAPAFRLTSDKAGATDTGQSQTAAFRSAADNVGATDLTSRFARCLRQLQDAAGATDLLSRLAPAFRTVADDVAIADLADAVLVGHGIHLLLIADLLGLTDAAATQTASWRMAADALGFTDALGQQTASSRLGTDALGFTDAAIRLSPAARQTGDTVGLTDAVGRAITAFRLIADALAVVDAARLIRAFTVLTEGRVVAVRARAQTILLGPRRQTVGAKERSQTVRAQ